MVVINNTDQELEIFSIGVKIPVGQSAEIIGRLLIADILEASPEIANLLAANKISLSMHGRVLSLPESIRVLGSASLAGAPPLYIQSVAGSDILSYDAAHNYSRIKMTRTDLTSSAFKIIDNRVVSLFDGMIDVSYKISSLNQEKSWAGIFIDGLYNQLSSVYEPGTIALSGFAIPVNKNSFIDLGFVGAYIESIQASRTFLRLQRIA